MSRTISVEIDLDHPTIQAAIDEEAGRIADDGPSLGDDETIIEREDLARIRNCLEDTRRYLTSPAPSPSEAMIYVERALETIARWT